MQTKKHNSLQKQISQKISLAALSGAIVWVVLLIATAAKVITPAFRGAYDMALGPLVLTRFTAEATACGGHTITFGFGSGLLWYFALWILLGTAVGYLTFKRSVL